MFTLVRMSGDKWISTAIFHDGSGNKTGNQAGVITLAGECDILRVATSGGQTFDAGTANVLVEF